MLLVNCRRKLLKPLDIASVRTVERVVAMKRASSGAAFQSPVKRYTANRARIVLENFDTEAIRRTILGLMLTMGGNVHG